MSVAETTIDASHRLRQVILVGLGLMLVAVPLYFSPSMSDYHTPKYILVQVFATILGALLLISMVLDGEVYILDHPIYYTMLAFLAANFISLFQAANIYQGLYSLWIQTCFFTVAILCFHCITSRRQVHALVGVMVAAGGVVAVIGLLQHNEVYHFYHRWNIAASTIGNVNFVAEYYNVVYPISLVLLLIVRRPLAWAAVLAACFAMTCHLIVMGSRGGWLGVLIAGGVIGGAELVRRYHVGRRALDAALVSILVALLTWPIMTSVASSLPVTEDQTLAQLSQNYWDRVVSRSTDALVLGDRSTRQRVFLWEDSFRLIMDRPLFGVGTGNYEFNIQKFLGAGSLGIKSAMESESGIEHMIFRAHNDYLEVWAESGLLGMIIFVILLAQIVRSVVRLLMDYVKGREEPLVIGLGAAVLATLAHALFSSNFQNPASAIVFWVVVGFVWVFSVAFEDRPKLGLLNTSSDGFSFGVAALGIVVVVFTCYHGYRMRQGAILFQDVRAQMTRQQFDLALETAETSLRYPSPRPFATYEMLGKLHHRFENWEEAQQAFEMSLRYHPNHPGAHYYLGRALVQQGQPEAAVDVLKRAIELEPRRPEYHATLATALGQMGRYDEGAASVSQALSLNPNLKAAYYALGGIERGRNNHEAALKAFDEVLALDPADHQARNSRAHELILMERYDEAIGELESLIEAAPRYVDPRMNLAVAYFSRGDDSLAIETCREILTGWPSYQPARQLLAAVYQQRGDEASARSVLTGELP